MNKLKDILGGNYEVITSVSSNEYNYKPLVGDSVTYDTPILIRDKNLKTINILPICDIFNEENSVEYEDGQYRDFSKKDYDVLTRSGWHKINYVYKHKTDKELRRIETKNGVVDCTIDHSLFNENREEVKPSELKRGDKIEIYTDALDYNKNSLITEDEAWLYGFFMADGSATYCNRKIKRFSQQINDYIYYNGKRADWKISNKSLDRLNRAKEILENSFHMKCSIKDHLKSSSVYNLVVRKTNFAKFFAAEFYTSYRYKKVPECVLNAPNNVKKAFLDGFCCGDGQGDTIDECIEFGQKSKVAMAGLYLILKELGYNFRMRTRKDKPEFLSFRFRNHRGTLLNEDLSNRKENEVWNNLTISSKSDFVYDISADGTFVNSLGMSTLHNTDGFNFRMPQKFRYTEEHPYISKGLGRNYPKGEKFTNVDADVAEFEDLYLNESYAKGVNKMGLGIDEYVPASINFARKNYADLLDAEKGKIKLVGNTIKSKKMPLYIEKFLDKAIKMLLYGQGKEFLEYYYDYIDDIYNLRIPLKDIASVGKIKTSIEDYQKSCETRTKADTKKARQAWYELVIKEGLDVNMGDAIYYINTGNKKGLSDVQRVTHYMIEGEDKTKELTKEYNMVKKKTDPKKTNERIYEGKSVQWQYDEPKKKWSCVKLEDYVKKYYPYAVDTDELIFNCELVPNSIIEDEEDHFCDEGFEYNVPKYIEQFNKRIRPLLVCFSKTIRTKIDPKTGKEVDNILVSNPQERKQFTIEESQLTSGEPYKETDQDTYEALMTMEDKEIKFWIDNNKTPLFVKEIGMDWDAIVEDYNKRQKLLEEKAVAEEKIKFDSILAKMKASDLKNGDFPESLFKIVSFDYNSGNFISKTYDVSYGNLFEILDERNINDGDDEDNNSVEEE